MADLYWFMPSRGIIALHPVSLYYAMNFDAPDRLRTVTFIVWRTAAEYLTELFASAPRQV
jgi:hypothetical protein